MGAQYANEAAVCHLSHALAPTPMDDLEGRYALLLARGKVYSRVADHATLRAVGQRVLSDSSRLSYLCSVEPYKPFARR